MRGAQIPKMRQTPQDARFGIITDCAGIQQHYIGILRTLAKRVASIGKDGGYQLAVVHIHLAAVGFYVKTLPHSANF